MEQSSSRVPIAITRKAIVALIVVSITYASAAHLRPILLRNRPLPKMDGSSGQCAVWFIGSSTFSRWSTLAQDMAPWRTDNRGVADALAGEIVTRFKADGPTRPPEAIVLYVGDNDLAYGESPADVTAEVAQFLKDANKRMWRTRVVVLGVKPSPARWSLRAEQLRLDAMIRREIDGQTRASFADVAPSLLVNGLPGPYFVSDGIHLNPDGYRIWGEAVRRAIEMSVGPGAVARCRARSRVAE